MKKIVLVGAVALILAFLIISDSDRVRLHDELERLSYRIKALELAPVEAKDNEAKIQNELQAKIQNELSELRSDLLRHKHEHSNEKVYLE